jgi:DNA-binding response OmpR family regulator
MSTKLIFAVFRASNRMKILVVEDNESMLNLIETTLKQENFIIDRAIDGEVALKKIKNNKYDLIILDIVLPKKDGFSIIASARAFGEKMPILAISANNLVDARIKAINLGADDFLVKDFSLKELVARVKCLLRRNSGIKNNVLRCKDLAIDMTNMAVFCKQKRIPLTKKEFQILLLLLRNKNTLVTREELQDYIWKGEDEQSVSNTITVHVRSLRRKLKESQDMIETVHGYGYIVRT